MIYLDKLEEAKRRCWTGYKRRPGSTPYSKGSCVKEGYRRIGKLMFEVTEIELMNLHHGAEKDLASGTRGRVDRRKRGSRGPNQGRRRSDGQARR